VSDFSRPPDTLPGLLESNANGFSWFRSCLRIVLVQVSKIRAGFIHRQVAPISSRPSSIEQTQAGAEQRNCLASGSGERCPLVSCYATITSYDDGPLRGLRVYTRSPRVTPPASDFHLAILCRQTGNPISWHEGQTGRAWVRVYAFRGFSRPDRLLIRRGEILFFAGPSFATPGIIRS